MKRLVFCSGAMALVLVAACQDTGTGPSAGALTIPSAFSATTYGFSNVSSSFASTGDTGPWAPDGGGFGFNRGPGGGGSALGFMGGGLAPDFDGGLGTFDHHRDRGFGPGFGPGGGFDLGPFGFGRLPSTCTFQTASGRVVCAAEARGGLTINRSFQFKNAAGTVQQSADSTTDFVNAQSSVAGTLVHRDNDTSTVNNSSNRTTTGLAYTSTKRTSNGTSAGTETTKGTDSTGHFVAVRTMGDTTNGVVVPIVDGRPTYPTAGSVIRSMKATITYDGKTPTSTSRREVITYDGSNTAKIVITQDGVTKNCTMPLPRGRLTCS
jgi:hypothetical protein